MAIDGHPVLVGASNDDHSGFHLAGSAYLFLPQASGWVELAKLTASDAAAGDFFRSSVAFGSGAVVVGARGDDHAGGGNAGSAYVYTP